MKIVVHIHDLPMWSLPPAQVERMRRALPEVEIVDVWNHEDCRKAIPDADVAVAPRMLPDTLVVAERLRWIHTTAVGVGWLPLREVGARGIPVTNSRGVHAEMLAEHAMALLLGVRRLIPEAMDRRAQRTWAQEELAVIPIPRLHQSTVLVYGLGEIGRRVAGYASGMGMRVIGVRRDLKAEKPEGVERVVSIAAARDLLPEVDAIVFAMPHTKQTGVILGVEELATLKATTVVVNVARGTLVDEAALAAALHEGRIGGAGLDVFAHEPLPESSPLWTTPRTLLTPHTGALDGDYWTPAIDLFLENWSRFVKGEALLNLVDLEKGY